VIPGPGLKQRHAFEAEQVGKRVLVDHGLTIARSMTDRTWL
jgi:hypothetical protein